MFALSSATAGVSCGTLQWGNSPMTQDSCYGGCSAIVTQHILPCHSLRAVGPGVPGTVHIAAVSPLRSDLHSLIRKRFLAAACWQLNTSTLSLSHLLHASCVSGENVETSRGLPGSKYPAARLRLQRSRCRWSTSSNKRGLSQGARSKGGAEAVAEASYRGAGGGGLFVAERGDRRFRWLVPSAVDAQRPAASEMAASSSEDDGDDMDAMSSHHAMMMPLASGLPEADEWRPMGNAADKLAESEDGTAGSPWLMMLPGGGPMSNDELHMGREAAGSMTYQAARRLLGSLADTMEALEEGLIRREQELALTTTQIEEILLQGPPPGDRVAAGDGAESSARESSSELREAEARIRKLSAHMAALQRDVETKDEAMAGVLRENKMLKKKLSEGENASEDVRKLRREIESRDTRLAALAFDVSSGNRTQEEKSRMQEALQAAELRVSKLMAEVAQLGKDLDLRDTLLDQMRTEAQLSSKALTMAAAAMGAAREKATELESQVKLASDERDAKRHALDETQAKLKESARREEELQRLRQELQDAQRTLQTVREENAKKDHMITLARREVTKTTEMLDLSKKAMRKAEEQIVALEAQVDKGQEALREEVEASSKALKSAANREQVLRMAEAKVRELTAELTSLRAVMDAKERTLNAVREETLRNADMLMAAANTREALVEAEKQVEMLTSHMEALEREVQSRDELFEEIRGETFRSTEALKLATLIKQELNASREREAELQQQLEEKAEIIEDLRRESADSSRMGHAEQALRSAEEKVEMLRLENETMRRGIETRDEALDIMKMELDRSVDMLGHASEDRDALQALQKQLADMEVELAAKDTRLRLLQDELASALGISPNGIRIDDGGGNSFAPWRPNQYLRPEQGRPSSSPSPPRPSTEINPQ